MIAAWPLYLVMAGFASTLMVVFGDGYDVASDVVLILALTMLLRHGLRPRRLRAAHGRPQLAQPAQQHHRPVVNVA